MAPCVEFLQVYLSDLIGICCDKSARRMGITRPHEYSQICPGHSEHDQIKAGPILSCLQSIPGTMIPGLAHDIQEARVNLRRLVQQLREIDVKQGGGHTAAADVVYIYACTQHWFTPGPGYKVCPCPQYPELISQYSADARWHVLLSVCQRGLVHVLLLARSFFFCSAHPNITSTNRRACIANIMKLGLFDVHFGLRLQSFASETLASKKPCMLSWCHIDTIAVCKRVRQGSSCARRDSPRLLCA